MDRITRCRDMAIRISKYHKGAFWTPILREGEVVGGFLYAPHRDYCAIECLRRSIQQGVVTFGQF